MAAPSVPRLVLDTNVLVFGLLTPHGPSARLVDLFQRGAIRLLYDDRIFQEYHEVLLRPRFGFSQEAVEVLLDLLLSEGEHRVAEPVAFRVSDRSDRPFLEVALSAGADLLVTGNRKDLPRRLPGSLRVVTPVEALRWLTGR